jgi:HTH-type transcriptional regulator/antitoxin HigA
MRPKVIKTARDHQSALKRVEALWDAPPGSSRAVELETWAVLIEAYEKERHPIGEPDPVEAVKFRLEQMGLKPSALVKALGGKNRVSEVLNGKRGLSTAMMRNLYRDLHIPAESLLAEPRGKYVK